MQRFQWIFLLSLMLISCVTLLACHRSEEALHFMKPITETTDDPQEISIGVVVSLTGAHANPYGFPMRRGFELALAEINDSRLAKNTLKLITIDDQSTEAGTIEAVEHLIAEGVTAIVGVAISDYLEDAFPLAQDAGIVAFSPISSAAGLSSLGNYIFRADIATDILIPAGVRATQVNLGYTKAAIIYNEDDTYSNSVKDEVKKALEANGVTLLAEEPYNATDTDFTAHLTRIKAMDVEAIFVAALATHRVNILKQGRNTVEIADDIPFLISGMSSAEVQQAGDAAEGAITFIGWSHLSDAPGNQAFLEKYQQIFDITAEPWAAQSYATLYILAHAIAKAESTEAAAIRDALAQTMALPTILGDFSFDPNGEARHDPVVLIVKNGELQLFK